MRFIPVLPQCIALLQCISNWPCKDLMEYIVVSWYILDKSHFKVKFTFFVFFASFFMHCFLASNVKNISQDWEYNLARQCVEKLVSKPNRANYYMYENSTAKMHENLCISLYNIVFVSSIYHLNPKYAWSMILLIFMIKNKRSLARPWQSGCVSQWHSPNLCLFGPISR